MRARTGGQCNVAKEGGASGITGLQAGFIILHPGYFVQLLFSNLVITFANERRLQ
jgi:hypothetical protein